MVAFALSFILPLKENEKVQNRKTKIENLQLSFEIFSKNIKEKKFSYVKRQRINLLRLTVDSTRRKI
jgi:hypothetical protein